jgi:L-fuculose-phosphate aldolase
MKRDKREALLHYASTIWERGWVANHEGNLSVRLGPGRFLCSPTSFSKVDITERDLIVVDDEGNRLRGFRRPFSEFALHRAVYEHRPDANAVIHAHPRSSTAFSVVGRGLPRPIVAEAVVSIGPVVPLVPFAAPGTRAFTANLVDYLERFDVLILENHGVLSFGDDLEQAYLRLEYCEHLADIERRALQIGEPRYLGWDEIQGLLDKRRRVGLGPEARGMSREDAYGRFFRS